MKFPLNNNGHHVEHVFKCIILKRRHVTHCSTGFC